MTRSASSPPLSLVASDERIQAAAQGDRKAMAALLSSILPRVRNLVRYFMRNDDIDDVVQDALIAIVRGVPSYRGEGTFTSWSDRVVARVAIDASRRRRSSAAQTTPMVDVAAEPRDEDYLARRRLVEALDTLSRELCETLVLHHVLDMSVPEIAEELAVPFETVRSRLRLGRARLRERLASAAPAEVPT